jgi:hypothetical protein
VRPMLAVKVKLEPLVIELLELLIEKLATCAS